MKVLQTRKINIKYKEGIANRLAMKTFKRWGYCLEKIGQKNTSSPFSNREWRWGLGFGLGFFICNVLHYTFLNLIMWNVSSITTNLLSRIGVGLRFTFKSRSSNDNSLFHFNFLFMCYNIHSLIISSHLSLVFKFLLRMCHPTTKTLKSLNNNQSKKEK